MPDVHEDLLWIWTGFGALHGSRMVGMGSQPIMQSEINAYMHSRNIVESERVEDFLHHIAKLDSFWMEWTTENARR